MAMRCLSTAAAGMLLMMCSAVLLNVQLGLLATLAEAGYSDFLLIGLGNALVAAAFAFWLLISRPPVPDLAELKWVVLAGVFFTMSYLLMVLAIRMGISLGDLAALNSANVVFAAFLGRCFLREALHWAHFGAVVCTVIGALLIAQPEFVFGHTGAQKTHWVAYVSSIASGLADACIYISSRRLSEASPWIVALSFTSQAAVGMLACSGLDGSLSFETFAASPLALTAWVVGLSVVGFVITVAFTLAAQWCPAAVSATVDIATRMISGYGGQMVFFGAVLQPLTVAGAVLMFMSVLAMTMVKPSTPDAEEQLHKDKASPTASSNAAAAVANQPISDDDDTESLASFIAAEFAGTVPREREMPVRLRKPTTGCEPESRTIGAVSAGAVVISMA